MMYEVSMFLSLLSLVASVHCYNERQTGLLVSCLASVPFILVGCIIMKVAKFLNTEYKDQPTTSSHLKPVLDSKLEGITELRCRIASRIVKAAQTTADGKEILTPRSP